MNREKIATRASSVSIGANVALSVFKLTAGIIGRSTAMVADAVHSISDILSSVIVIAGIKLAGKDADKEHPYGHERFECVAAIILSVILFITGGAIGWSGVNAIIDGDFRDIAMPGMIALIAAVVSLVVKEFLFWFIRGAAKKIDSGALMADAWHARTDALSSVGSFVGILGARLGVPIMDPLAAFLICLLIFKAALEIFRDAIGKMTDKACDDDTENQMRRIILEQQSVLGIDMLKTRLFGDRIYVDVEIAMDGEHSLHEAHDTAQLVHDAIESRFAKVKHCTVHVNPGEKP